MPSSPQAAVQCLHLLPSLVCTLHFNMSWFALCSLLFVLTKCCNQSVRPCFFYGRLLSQHVCAQMLPWAEKYTWTMQMALLLSFFEKCKGPPPALTPFPLLAMARFTQSICLCLMNNPFLMSLID